jgi:plastocyanin
MFKKEVDIALLVIFFILFLGVGIYIGVKDQNGEKLINPDSLKVWGAAKTNTQPEVANTPVPEEKAPNVEMPSPVYDLFLNNAVIIEIKNTKYFPESMNITVGTNVTWKNTDSNRQYQVYDRSAQQEFNSFGLAPDQSYSHIFDKPGIYYFGDAIFKYMKGTINVVK